MAALAQTVNVLQALILTDKEKMLLTPTYYVFDLYKAHQDAKYLPIKFTSPDYVNGTDKLPALNASASIDSNKVIHISLVNIDNSKSISINTELKDLKWSSVSGQIITSGKVTDVNTFDKPGQVVITPFNGAKKDGNNLIANLPPHSVVMLELK